jgi:phage tail-like protein
MIFKDFIFNLFPSYFKENDSYKNGNGEGLFERYLRCFGEEIDNEILPYLENYLDELDPVTASSKMLQHISDSLGNPPDIFLNETQYRNILRYAVDVYKIKGTAASYQLLFSLLGYNTNIIEYTADEYIYDNGWFYDEDPFYDSSCPLCSEYSLLFTNASNPLSPISLTILALLESIIYWVEPINARLRNLINNIQVIDQPTLCIKEGIVIKKLEYGKYDNGLIYDDVILIYDDVVNLTILNTSHYNCLGILVNMGIGYDIIETDLIVY